jgi:hypothetical protein
MRYMNCVNINDLIINSLGTTITLERVIFWFNLLNWLIFDGVLIIFDEIHIKRTRGYYGLCCQYEYGVEGSDTLWYNYELVIHDNLSLSAFLNTLGHEMVHLYQSQYLKSHDMLEPEEDDIFFQFETKFNKIGISTIKIE